MDRVTRLLGASRERLYLAAALLLAAAAAGCTPKIGDKCVLSTDCSQQGTLVCDTCAARGILHPAELHERVVPEQRDLRGVSVERARLHVPGLRVSLANGTRLLHGPVQQ